MRSEARVALDRLVRELGGTPSEVVRLPGGSVNHTFRVRLPSAPDVVVRVPVDAERSDEYPAEAWAMRMAAASNISVPTVVSVGVVDDVPFLVSAFVPADEAPVRHPWRWLGEYARRVGAIRLDGAPPSVFSRFGPDLAAAWSAHLSYNLGALGEADRVRRDGGYTSAAALRTALESLESFRFKFGPAHGDLAPRNLVSRGAEAAPVLIDWGSVTTGPAPWTDAVPVRLASIFDRSVTAGNMAEFLSGAGIDAVDDQPVLDAFCALSLIDTTRWAADQRPDLYRNEVRRCRRGLVALGLSA